MISKAVFDVMNTQIKHELYSAYLYLSMAAYFENENLPGFANWMYIQAGEEQGHAMKFFHHIIDRGGRVSLQAIEMPPVDFASPKDVFKMSYEHEQKVTSLINNIYQVAGAEKDTASQVFLHWFIDEQVEEERNASQILDLLEKAGSSFAALYELDHHLGRRKAGE